MDICLPGAPGAPVLNGARAAASRRNGAKSRGPKTPEGKARSAQNALKHGMRAQKCIVLPGERAAAFEAFEAALLADLAPEGALQTVLAQRIVAASWRLARAKEAELFCEARLDGATPGLALALAVIRDGRGAGAFASLLRYRGSASAELWRALRTLKALQAEQATRPQPEASDPAPDPSPESPDEPEARGNPGESGAHAASTPDTMADPATPLEAAPASDATRGHAPDANHDAPDRPHTSLGTPIEPEGRTNPRETTSLDEHEPAARAA